MGIPTGVNKDEFNVDAKVVLPNIKKFRKKLIKLIWDNSYGQFRNQEIGGDYEEYADFLADQIIAFIAESEEYKIKFK